MIDTITSWAAMILAMVLCAAFVTPFYNGIIAYNFNLPTFSYWEVLFGVWVARFILFTLTHNFTTNKNA